MTNCMNCGAPISYDPFTCEWVEKGSTFGACPKDPESTSFADHGHHRPAPIKLED
jgi:hypothetical protein